MVDLRAIDQIIESLKSKTQLKDFILIAEALRKTHVILEKTRSEQCRSAKFVDGVYVYLLRNRFNKTYEDIKAYSAQELNIHFSSVSEVNLYVKKVDLIKRAIRDYLFDLKKKKSVFWIDASHQYLVLYVRSLPFILIDVLPVVSNAEGETPINNY